MIWQNWLIAFAVLLIIEIATPGVFYFACLSIGALFAGLASLVFQQSYVHWIVFIAVSILSIYFIRPIAQKLMAVKAKKFNVDELIGKEGVITSPITPPALGMVKIGGETWRAESSDILKEGERCKIVAIEGTRLEVKKI